MQIIAHRGASARQVENSAAAFKAALIEGVDGIETDLQLSRDGEIFLFHDDDLRRLTGVRGALESLTAEKIRTLRLPHGQALMTLAELLTLLRGKKLLLNLELKGSRSNQMKLAASLATTLDPGPHPPQLLVSSFMPAGLERLRMVRSDVPRALLWNGRGLFPLVLRRARKLEAAALHVALRTCSGRRVDAIHAAGMACRVYTVNHPAIAEKCRSMGVDGIFTDDPARLRAAMTAGVD